MRKKRALGGSRFAFLTHVDLHWPTPGVSLSQEQGRRQSGQSDGVEKEEAMRVDASVAQVLQVAKLRPIRAWCSLSSLSSCPQQAHQQGGTLSLDSSGGGGGRLSLVVNEDTFEGLGLPGRRRRRQAHPKKRRRRRGRGRGRGCGRGQGEYELSFSLHKVDDVAGLERVMAYFSEPQHFLIASVPPVALHSLFPASSGQTVLRVQHKRQERDLLVPQQLLLESALGDVNAKEVDAFVAFVGLQSQGAQIPNLLADLSREQKKEQVRGSPPAAATTQQLDDHGNNDDNSVREGRRRRVTSQKVLTESLRGVAISREGADTVLERASSLVSSSPSSCNNNDKPGTTRWAIVSVSGYSSEEPLHPSSSPCLPSSAAAAGSFSFLSVSLLFLPGGRVHVVQ